MKSFIQTRYVLDLSRQFHRQLSEFYGQLADRAERQRVKLLLAYLSRHEDYLRTCLEGYEERVPRATLDTWLQYVPDEPPLGDLATLTVEPAMTVKDVTEIALRLDDGLIGFYRALADEAASSEVRDLFDNLLEMERHEQMALRREDYTV
jgi:rubrerythrin